MNTLKKLITIGLMLISLSAFAEWKAVPFHSNSVISFEDGLARRVMTEKDLVDLEAELYEDGVWFFTTETKSYTKEELAKFFPQRVAKEYGYCLLEIYDSYATFKREKFPDITEYRIYLYRGLDENYKSTFTILKFIYLTEEDKVVDFLDPEVAAKIKQMRYGDK